MQAKVFVLRRPREAAWGPVCAAALVPLLSIWDPRPSQLDAPRAGGQGRRGDLEHDPENPPESVCAPKTDLGRYTHSSSAHTRHKVDGAQVSIKG